MRRIVAAAIGGALAALAGIAVAETLSATDHNDYDAPGRHQFYVWCAQGADYSASEQGANAEDAQIKLYDAIKAGGHDNCWPVWQGRLAGS